MIRCANRRAPASTGDGPLSHGRGEICGPACPEDRHSRLPLGENFMPPAESLPPRESFPRSRAGLYTALFCQDRQGCAPGWPGNGPARRNLHGRVVAVVSGGGGRGGAGVCAGVVVGVGACVGGGGDGGGADVPAAPVLDHRGRGPLMDAVQPRGCGGTGVINSEKVIIYIYIYIYIYIHIL